MPDSQGAFPHCILTLGCDQIRKFPSNSTSEATSFGAASRLTPSSTPSEMPAFSSHGGAAAVYPMNLQCAKRQDPSLRTSIAPASSSMPSTMTFSVKRIRDAILCSLWVAAPTSRASLCRVEIQRREKAISATQDDFPTSSGKCGNWGTNPVLASSCVVHECSGDWPCHP